MNATELFYHLKALVGAANAADMVSIKFPEWSPPSKVRLLIGEEPIPRRCSVSDGSNRLHKRLWEQHPHILKHLGAALP
jgi:hypothetical protein